MFCVMGLMGGSLSPWGVENFTWELKQIHTEQSDDNSVLSSVVLTNRMDRNM